MFINTSRAEVVDQEALARAVAEKPIRVGLDVFAKEPAGGAGEFTDEIVELAGVYGTPHIRVSTEQAQEAIAAEPVRIIRTFRETGKVPNVVNLARTTPATGVLAAVLDSVRAAGINVQEMENIIFEGAEAAVARIHLESCPSEDVHGQIRASSPHILEVGIIER